MKKIIYILITLCILAMAAPVMATEMDRPKLAKDDDAFLDSLAQGALAWGSSALFFGGQSDAGVQFESAGLIGHQILGGQDSGYRYCVFPLLHPHQ